MSYNYIKKATYECPQKGCNYTSRLQIGGYHIPEDRGHSSKMCPIHRQELVQQLGGKVLEKEKRNNRNRRLKQRNNESIR